MNLRLSEGFEYTCSEVKSTGYSRPTSVGVMQRMVCKISSGKSRSWIWETMFVMVVLLKWCTVEQVSILFVQVVVHISPTGDHSPRQITLGGLPPATPYVLNEATASGPRKWPSTRKYPVVPWTTLSNQWAPPPTGRNATLMKETRPALCL